MEQVEGTRFRPEKLSRKRVRHGAIEQLWNRHETRMKPSRDRIKICKEAREGKQLFSLPTEFDVQGAESLIVSLPQRQVIPLKTSNVLARKQPRFQRFPVGNTLKAGLIAGNIETWVNAAVEKKINWGELIGKLFLDGEVAVMVIPSLADWQHSPDFMDSLTQEEFATLEPETRKRYRRVNEYDEPIEDDDYDDMESSKRKKKSKKKTLAAIGEESRYVRVDERGNPMPKARYLRDSQNREPDDGYYTESKRKFREDRSKTEKAFEVEQQHWLLEELPFRISTISASQCLPIFGLDQELEGLIVKRTFSRDVLLSHDYIWEEDSDLLTEEPDDHGEVVLYEYWGTDTDGTPYVSYSVNGSRTHFRSFEDNDPVELDAVIDLRKEFGLRKLPIMYVWGLHFETEDVRMKGIPFLWPVLGAITGVEALATSVLVHSYSTAFGAWGIQADPQIIRDFPELLTEASRPRTFKTSPMTMTILPGRPYPLVHPGVGKDVKDLMNMLMQASSSMSPSDIAFGGGTATSGHDRALSREYLETSMNQVLEGALKAYQFVGERVLEISCGITKTTGVNIPVYATVPVPQTTGNKNKSQSERAIIELRPEWIGPIYNLSAFYPRSAGENMAELQQLAQLYLQGLVTFREFREKGFGDENPAATLLEIFTDQYLKTDAGRTEIAQLAAEIMGADSETEKQKLIEQKRLTPGGVPIAALPPELQALNTGEIPPGVDAELFLTKLQGMLAHDKARAALNPSGPLGPGTPPSQLGAPGPVIPPAMTPQGAPGPATAQVGGGMNEQAPTLSGMSLPNAAAQAVGGRVAGEIGTASNMRDSAAAAQMG